MSQRIIAFLLCLSAAWKLVAAETNSAAISATPNFSPGAEYADNARMFQGVPGIERAANGRLWATWYGGGVSEDRNNYILLSTSGDDGKSWQRVLILDPDGAGPVRAFDPCLWHDPDGKLWLTWAQAKIEQGKWGQISLHAITTTDSGDADAKWSAPREITKGVMMNKPTVASDGRWLLPAAAWFTNGSSRVVVSSDHGKTFGELGAANIPNPKDRDCDEHMVVERKNGSLWMLVRTKYGIGESISTDGGKTWPDLEKSSIPHTVSRFFIRKLASGHLLLVRHDPPNLGKDPVLMGGRGRSSMKAFLSDDDGRTWKGGLMLDERWGVTYPDGVQAASGLIYVIYDYNRASDKEILLTKFREEDVLACKFVSPDAATRVLINKATGINPIVFANAKPNANTNGVPLLTAPPAELDCAAGEAAGFEEGMKLFSNRNYTAQEVPAVLHGCKFIRGSIDGIRVVCRQAGVVYVVTPTLGRNPDSCELALLGRGFQKVNLPEIQLFAGKQNLCSFYQKQITVGDTLELGKWVVLVVPEKIVRKQALPLKPSKPWTENDGELLYNGIRLPQEWPPRSIDPKSTAPMPVPYLEYPPKVIPIDLGRQLFVDDFLIEQTDLKRTFYHAQKFEGNPVLKPETELELNSPKNAIACPKSGGVWWDATQQVYRMWYEAGWIHTICYATSRDGIHWERPNLDIQLGSNRILDPAITPDSWTVFPDYDGTNSAARWKMYLRPPGGDLPGLCMTSADGIHWSKPVESGLTGDRSTMFYNPFRKKWIYSLRSGVSSRGRCRHYWECDDFLAGAKWPGIKSTNDNRPVFWTAADKLDLPDPQIGDKPQLYNLDAVAYESIMLGIYEMHLGPDNGVCAKTGLPKITELNLAYSRDGFHWARPDRTPFIPAARRDVWDRGYVQSVGGVCLVRDDKLWFYYIGFQGDTNKVNTPWLGNGMYARGSTGVAFMRRDGFVSMDAGEKSGTLTTRPVTFSGKQLFVNADCPQGELRVEILDAAGKVIAPFTKENCEPVRADTTKQVVHWKNGGDLSALAGKPVRFRFHLTNGKLYAFWVSPDDSGVSRGYVAAGGPEFNGYMDTTANKTASASADVFKLPLDKTGRLKSANPDLSVAVKGADEVGYQFMIDLMDMRQRDITKTRPSRLPAAADAGHSAN